MEEDHLNTEGVLLVGEINTRAFRDVVVAEDHENAYKSGRVEALTATLLFVQGLFDAAGPYDDTRSMGTMIVWLGDRIREVNATTPEVPHG